MTLDLSSVIIAAIAATPGLIASLGARRASRETLASSQGNAKKADTLLKETEDVHRKTVEIHETTNGNLTKVTMELQLAREEIKSLHAFITTIMALQIPTKPEVPAIPDLPSRKGKT